MEKRVQVIVTCRALTDGIMDPVPPGPGLWWVMVGALLGVSRGCEESGRFS